MSTQEYIESGILELYVYGKLNELETEEVHKMAQQHSEIREEIVAIEKTVILLSGSVAPHLSGQHYEAIKQQIFENKPNVVEIKKEPKKSNISQYLGWAAAILLLLGGAYLYQQLDINKKDVLSLKSDKKKMKEEYTLLVSKNKVNEDMLSLVRDTKNTIIALGGQEVSPEAYAKVYWNQETHTVYVDAAGLPEPPEGMVYQVWALKLNPLTPLSIGLLDNFKGKSMLIFPVDNVIEAEAFGITLEPDGGSTTPTLENLYTLGKV
ncbi:MAG TPA: anti-sigma factor [Flavobacterium sp.]|nr:anti-sigma factor [Flavobacterium sp.]